MTTHDAIEAEVIAGQTQHPGPASGRDVGVWLALIQGEMQLAFYAYRHFKDSGRRALSSVTKIAAMARRCLDDHETKLG